jgi:two-component sensor histidine kinase
MHIDVRRDETDHPLILVQEPGFYKPGECTLPSCAAITGGTMELERLRNTEAELLKSLARERLLVEQKDELIRHKDLLSRESDHRLLNGLQMVTSLLSMQSRLTKNSEAAEQLKIAASRVATIGSVHRSLHASDNLESVELTGYLEGLCKDISGILPAERGGNALVVDGIPLTMPSATGIPLGFIVSEMVTNSAKYASGTISVRLSKNPDNGYALSVSDCGAGLPKEFDPAKSKGLGMRIVLSLVRQIGGELRFSAGDDNRGTRFTVLFNC